MLDIKFIRENTDNVKTGVEARNCNASIIDDILKIDIKRRDIIQEVEQLKAENNKAAKEIGQLKKDGKDAESAIKAMKSITDKIKELDAEQQIADKDFMDKMLLVPNLQHESVPVGKDETANTEIRTWGEKPAFDFKPKPHWDIAEHLDILDNKRAAKITGARFTL